MVALAFLLFFILTYLPDYCPMSFQVWFLIVIFTFCLLKSLQTEILRPDLWSVCAQSCPAVCDSVDCSLPGSSVHGIFQATQVGCHFLFSGMFLTQGLTPPLSCLLHWQVDSLPLHHLGSPLILESQEGVPLVHPPPTVRIKTFVSAPSMSTSIHPIFNSH